MTELPERNLDLIRAFAVASVVVDHAVISSLPPQIDYRAIITVGNFGVLLFFTHTALVLMGSLERQGTRPDWVRAFYIRRAFRIYPLSIAMVLAVLALRDPAAGHSAPHGVSTVYPPLDAATIVSNLALVQNLAGKRDILGLLWTLPIELEMYLFFPLCFLAARKGSWHMVALFAAAGVGYEIAAHPLFPEIQRAGVLAYAPCFLGGVLAYHLLRRGTTPRLPSWMLAVVVALALAWLYLVIQQPHQPLRWVVPLALGASIPFIRHAPESWLTKAAHTTCTYSYGAYLTHVPVLWLANERLHDAPVPLRVAVGIVGILGLPWIAYHLIERPGIDLGKRLVRGPVTEASLAPAP